MNLSDSAQKGKCMNTLESYHIHYFHQHNMITTEKTRKKIPYSN